MTSVCGSPKDLEPPGHITHPPHGRQLPQDLATWDALAPRGRRRSVDGRATETLSSAPRDAAPAFRLCDASCPIPPLNIYSSWASLHPRASPRPIRPACLAKTRSHASLRHSSRAARRQARRNAALAQLSNPSRRIGPLTTARPRYPSNLHPSILRSLASCLLRGIACLAGQGQIPDPPIQQFNTPLGQSIVPTATHKSRSCGSRPKTCACFPLTAHRQM